MNASRACPDAATLERFVCGRLPAADLHDVAFHVRECEHCRGTIDALRGDDTLVAAPDNEVNDPMSDHANPSPAAAPAGANDDASSAGRAAVDDICLRFDTAWRGGSARIEDHLPAEDAPHYLAALEELVHIDLERQWKRWERSRAQPTGPSSEPARVENYLERFARLHEPAILQRLVQAEFEVRERVGAAPAIADYRTRFPGVSIHLDDETQWVAANASAAAALPDIQQLGSYRIVRVLGVGGMGIVYEAEDSQLRRRVAVKVMKPEFAALDEPRQRFLREARAAAALTHDHIVAIHQVGEDAGRLYLAMPLLTGESLEDRLRRDHRLPIADAVRIARETAEGLAAAHARSLIHRDVKPANIWLEQLPIADGESPKESAFPSRVKLMDFGLARTNETEVHLTQSGAVVGTPAYLAPEQARGEPIDGRADLFSLGCMLYRMTTGKLPFHGRDMMSTLTAIALDTPPPPHEVNAEIPADVSHFIQQLLAKDPGKRPASARAAGDALKAIERSLSDQTVPHIPAVAVAAPALRRSRRWTATVAAALAAVAAVAALMAAPLILRIKDRDGKVREVELQPGTTLEVVEQSKDVPAKGPPLPDKERPFVLVRAGAGEKVEAESWGKAFEQLRDGDVLEIHGNGPFFVPTVTVKDKAFTLRAGPGYRPQLQGIAGIIFQLDNVRFTAEDCDLRTTVQQRLVSGTGSAWEFRACRLLGPAGSVASYHGPKLTFTDCLIWAPPDSGDWDWLQVGPGKMQLELSNCLILAGGHGLIHVRSDCDWQVTLRNNTVMASGGLLVMPDGEKNPRLDVRATGNIFQLDYGPLHSFAWMGKEHIRWEGNHNVYFRSSDKPDNLALYHDKEGKKRTIGLAAWEEFWGRKEPGSVEAPAIDPSWRQHYAAKSAAALVTAVRNLARGAASGQKGAAVGPDWDLVGPGEAYERARAAEAKPAAAKSERRPKTAEGFFFAVLRDGKVVRDFQQLVEAIYFAQTGDVVELRTDGPIGALSYGDDPKAKQLTIRAAPGYLPVVRGNWGLNAQITATVEGLHFQGCVLGAERLRRLANCSFSSPPDIRDGKPMNVGLVDAPLEIVNCVIPGGVQMYSVQKGQVVIRNSFVGVIKASGDGGALRAEVERSYLSQPNLFFSYDGLAVFEAHLGKAGSAELVVRDSLLDSIIFGLVNIPQETRWQWTGQRNVYRSTLGPWCYAVPDGAAPPRSLARWQALWNSDADSVQLDTLMFDPLMWKLLPGTPGQGVGPGGADLGADVQRVAPAPR